METNTSSLKFTTQTCLQSQAYWNRCARSNYNSAGHYVYLLFLKTEEQLWNNSNIYFSKIPKRCYRGYTTNPCRRIRCHNRLIKGGAKKTEFGKGDWKMAILISGFKSNKDALRFEWLTQHFTSKSRVNGEKNVLRRIHELFTSTDKTKLMYKNLGECWDEMKRELKLIAHPCWHKKLKTMIDVFRTDQLLSWNGL